MASSVCGCCSTRSGQSALVMSQNLYSAKLGTLWAGASLTSLRINAPRLRANSWAILEAGMLTLESGYATWPLN